jgi:ATP-dependent DNA ligase
MKMTNKEFLQYFSNMEPMKYYEGDTNSIKAKDMIENKNDQFYAMEKRDGEWCRAIIHEDGVLLQSRSISKKTGTYGDKTALVPHIVEGLRKIYPAGTVLLGELAFSDSSATSKDVGSILRCLAPKAIERQKEKPLYFYPFDMLAYDYDIMVDSEFEKRLSLLYLTLAFASDYIRIIEICFDSRSFMEFADSIWANGGEGIMIVRKDMKYAPGKRTAWQSLKIKKKLETFRAKVIGFIEPNKLYEGKELDNWKFFVDKNGNPADLTKMIDFGSLTAVTKPFYYGWKNGVIVQVEGRIVGVTSGLTDEVRDWLATDAAEALREAGQLFVNITGMEMTEDSIRHPVFLGINI